MRVFQVFSFYREYLDYFDRLDPAAANGSYADRLSLLLEDRFNAVHLLEPIYHSDPEVKWTVGNDSTLQRKWAFEHKLKSDDAADILLAQIEDHRTEVLYNLDPVQWDTRFLRRLPGCVKKTICWRAAPSNGADLSGFDLRVCNFPHILHQWEEKGWRSAFFSPSHDPVMQEFAGRTDREIDIAFVGSYTRHHQQRNRLLEVVAAHADRFRMVLGITSPQRKPLIDLPLLRRVPGFVDYLPKVLRKACVPSVFGRQLYDLFGRAKIVLNAAIDMSCQYRGNMRCFEAMGCGASMLSDQGIYQDGFEPGKHFLVFTSPEDALAKVESLLSNAELVRTVGRSGEENLRNKFSKGAQWNSFQKLVETI